MSRRLPFLLNSAVIILAALSALAIIVPSLDLPALCERADVIVVGRAVDVREAGPTSIVTHGTSSAGRLMVVELSVEKTLKGQTKSTALSFSFSLPATSVVSSGHRPIAAQEFGVFFLRRIVDGFEVLDPYYPSVVAYPGAPRTAGTLLDQVTGEVAHVLSSPEAPLGAKKNAVSVLGGVGTPAATAALRTAARDQLISIRLSAIAALLRRNDISVLDSAQQVMLSEDPKIDQTLKAAVASGLRDGVKDPRAVPILTRLMVTKDHNVRRGAASALRNTRDRLAIDPLTQALYDSDREVQYQAVIGLAEITGAASEWSPASETFEKDRKKYLDYWRDWAKSRK